MATKVFIKNNYITVDIPGDEDYLNDHKSRVFINVINHLTNEYVIESEKIGTRKVLLADLTDEGGTPYDFTTWTDFYTSNTGFNLASGSGAEGLDGISPDTIPVMNGTGDSYIDSSITETASTVSISNNLDIADGFSLTGGAEATIIAFVEPEIRDVMLGNADAVNFLVTNNVCPRALITSKVTNEVDLFDGLTENISTSGTSYTIDTPIVSTGFATSYTLHFTEPKTDVTIEFVVVDSPDNHQLYKQTLDTFFDVDDRITETAPLGVYNFIGQTLRLIVTVPSGDTNISGFDTGSFIVPNLQISGLATINKDVIVEQTKIEITSSFTIDSSNIDTYNRNLLFTPTTQTAPVVITIDDDINIDYFNINRLGSGTITIDATSPEVINGVLTQIIDKHGKISKIKDAIYALETRSIDSPFTNVEQLDGTADKTHTEPSVYLVDASNNEQRFKIFVDTTASFIVRDVEKEFNDNSVFIDIYNSDGVTVDHTAELDKKDRSTQFYKVGSTWYYSEEGKGEVKEIASSHISSVDFKDVFLNITKIGTTQVLSGAISGEAWVTDSGHALGEGVVMQGV